MNIKTYLLSALGVALLATACSTPSVKLETTNDSITWAAGQNLGEALKNGPMNGKVNNELLVEAIRQTLAGNPSPLTDSAYNALIVRMANEFSRQAQAQANQSQPVSQPAAGSNQSHQHPKTTIMTPEQADRLQAEYLNRLAKENKKVRRHPSGFYYEVIKQGTGANTKYAQRIEFDYRSYLMLTGELFDQTYGVRKPIMHVVGTPMFPGLIDAFQLMNPGSIYRFYFPYQLAFGTEGNSNSDIPPCTPLIYEVELHHTYND